MRVFITVILAFCLIVWGCKHTLERVHYTQIKIGQTSVQASIAITTAEQIRGLQQVKQLNAGSGMLFIYRKPQVLRFWMREMLIPLDIIWINQDKKIIRISENVPVCQQDPCATYSSEDPAQYVLEVNAGFAAAHDIVAGMSVEF